MSASPEERLASHQWRTQSSLWVLTSVLGLGFLGFAGFLTIGVKARRAQWLFAALLWLVASVAVYAVNWDEPPPDAVLGGYYWVLIPLAWALQIVHQVMTRREWLTWRAHHPTAYERRAAARAGLAPEPSAAVAPGVVDINRASASQLIDEAGLAPGWAATIVATRDRLGPFESVDQLVTVSHLPPEVFVAVRHRVAVVPDGGSPSAGGSPPPPTRGRRLELS